MKYTVLAIALLFIAACSKQEQESEKVGTAMSSSFNEVIGPENGYIIENAALASDDEQPVFAIANVCKLVHATTSVLVVHSKDGGTGTILALQVPSFAPGSEINYDGDPGSGTFFVYGSMGTDVLEQETGVVSGMLRLQRTETSEINLGLNREVKKGLGEMEIVVSNIERGQLNIPTEKKYAARYELPVITLDELVKINVAS